MWIYSKRKDSKWRKICPESLLDFPSNLVEVTVSSFSIDCYFPVLNPSGECHFWTLIFYEASCVSVSVNKVGFIQQQSSLLIPWSPLLWWSGLRGRAAEGRRSVYGQNDRSTFVWIKFDIYVTVFSFFSSCWMFCELGGNKRAVYSQSGAFGYYQYCYQHTCWSTSLGSWQGKCFLHLTVSSYLFLINHHTYWILFSPFVLFFAVWGSTAFLQDSCPSYLYVNRLFCLF